MFLDKETESPVRTKKKVTVYVTQEILDQNYPYGDGGGCSVFHALQEAGLPIAICGSYFWIDKSGDVHPLPYECSAVGASLVGNYDDSRRAFMRPFSFEIEYP